MKFIIDTSSKNLVGPLLKKARINANLTQQQLSNKLEILAIYIDRASISKIERQRRIVTDYELVGLAKILNMKVEDLLDSEV